MGEGIQHVVIIMDGNGRWAERRGLPPAAGHRQGLEAAKAAVRAAQEHGLQCLTLFGFSEDNWRRPVPEVDAILALFESLLTSEADRLADEGVKFRMIGSRERLSLRDYLMTVKANQPSLLDAIATNPCFPLWLRPSTKVTDASKFVAFKQQRACLTSWTFRMLGRCFASSSW